MNPDIKRIFSGNYPSLFVVAGPCAVEEEDICMNICEELVRLCTIEDIPFIFKASFRKANRTTLGSFTGIGDDKALAILRKVKEKFEVPILTDIHETKDIERVVDFVDVIQIPAFLSRQTELIVSAARTMKAVNIKKGQFMNAQSMAFAVEKVKMQGNKFVMVTERGNSFGYDNLVVDFRNVAQMKTIGVPVLMDCTHSTQRPNQDKGETAGGHFNEVEIMAKAGLSSGADGLFIEVHPDPSVAASDSSTMVKLDLMEAFLNRSIQLKKALKRIYE